MLVAFDVDDTLIRDEDSSPRNGVIAMFKDFAKRGYDMMIWSRGGKDHAQEVADRLGLDYPTFDKDEYTGPKPDIAVDDFEPLLGKRNIRV